jgi:hypothetical protein
MKSLTFPEKLLKTFLLFMELDMSSSEKLDVEFYTEPIKTTSRI